MDKQLQELKNDRSNALILEVDSLQTEQGEFVPIWKWKVTLKDLHYGDDKEFYYEYKGTKHGTLCLSFQKILWDFHSNKQIKLPVIEKYPNAALEVGKEYYVQEYSHSQNKTTPLPRILLKKQLKEIKWRNTSTKIIEKKELENENIDIPKDIKHNSKVLLKCYEAQYYFDNKQYSTYDIFEII